MSVRDVVQAAAGVGGGNEYVEDVFSTYLHTGNNSTQTINNGIDLDGEGGLVWIKGRSLAYNNTLNDTERGAGQQLVSNRTDAQAYYNNGLTSFSSTGFSIGAQGQYNLAPETYASWTFRKAPKFFDIVTWTGNGVAGREIPHNLGSVPGCIIVKNLELGTNWIVYHQGANGGVNPEQYSAYLDATNAFMSGGEVVWGDGTTAFAPTSTHFTIYSSNDLNRASSLNTYVAYVFAHDAGGFGDDGEQNVISCGSYVGDGTTNKSKKITLGYEPQFLIMKPAQSAPSGFNGWNMLDIMRGITTGGNDPTLLANTNGAEDTTNDLYSVEADGFRHTYGGTAGNDNGITYIYIAIRRPMKTPEAGTEVFAVNAGTSTGVTSSFTTDLVFPAGGITGDTNYIGSRLQGGQSMNSYSTGIEQDTSSNFVWDRQTGWGTNWDTYYAWMFKRAPGFMDVVCYTGDGISGREVPHNLGVAPELMIVKGRTGVAKNWGVWCSYTPTKDIRLNLSGSYGDGNTATTSSTTFTLQGMGGTSAINASGATYVTYLFGSVSGVSKVGSYTGTGADLNVDCGFSAGARFILIKRTDGDGDWRYWDSVRGITTGNDPFLRYNSSGGQQTGTDLVEPLPSGFIVTGNGSDPGWDQTNKLNSTYIFLAIA